MVEAATCPGPARKCRNQLFHNAIVCGYTLAMRTLQMLLALALLLAPRGAAGADGTEPEEELQGPVYVLESIEIRGNQKTSDATVLFFVQMTEGESFSPGDGRLEKTKYSLLATGYFSDVDLSLEKGSERGDVVLVITLVERSTFVFRDLVLGFSDITALELAALALAGVATVHGPSIASLARQPRTYLDHLFRLLEDPAYDFGPPPRRLKSLNQGRVQGPIVGGNLTMIDQLVGTPFLPELAGCVLFIEDVKEAPYRIDRMLTHLGNAGVLDRIVGVVAGDFAGCRPRADGVSVEDVILDHVRRQRIPAAKGMPSGHGKHNWAFIQGARVDLKCGYRGEGASLTAAKD